jgi:L-asparaginase
MKENVTNGTLEPFEFSLIEQEVPELKMFGYDISSISFNPPLDSSNVGPESWVSIASIIGSHYYKYDGFVVLHGTDTMAYSASAVSFLLENISKPVIFTGSQLPIGRLRTDGRENLITAVEIAAAMNRQDMAVPEVAIYFENILYRANRTTKISADQFHAFESSNYPHLAETGIFIKFNYDAIHHADGYSNLVLHDRMDTNVMLLKLFPGMTELQLRTVLNMSGLKGVVLETYGSGNAPTTASFINLIREKVEKGIIFVNITQCQRGGVRSDLYQTGLHLEGAGVLNGFDMTTEAALTKLMFLLGQYDSANEIKMDLNRSLRGEITVD